MNKNCNYCSELKTIHQYEKIIIENRFLNSILQKNNIIIKQDSLITELYDKLKIYLSQNELDKIENTMRKRFSDEYF